MNGEGQKFAQRASEALAGALGPGAGPVLDLACGTGTHARTLADLGWTPLGLDLSWAQLRYARRRMPVIAADAAVPPLRPGTLAAVSAVMCHTDIDDYAAACRALVPALRPGGTFVHVGVHPCYIGAFADRSNPSGILITPGYWRKERRFEAWSPRGVRARVGATHLPISELLNGFTGAGLSIEWVAELGHPTPDVLAVRCRRHSRPGPTASALRGGWVLYGEAGSFSCKCCTVHKSVPGPQNPRPGGCRQRLSCSILSLNRVVAMAALWGWPLRKAWANFLAWS